MRVILTHYGYRLVLHQAEEHGLDVLAAAPGWGPLVGLWAELWGPWTGEPWQVEAMEQGLIEIVGPAVSREDVRLRYRRNPLEHIERVVFEYTTLCNLSCGHCRNGQVAPRTEPSPARLMEVIDRMVPLGVLRYDFIGGEVLLYGRGWLEVVRHARRHAGTVVSVLTSGWFIGELGFLAAGERYADDAALLGALAEAGVTHVTFSLDGPPAFHDRSRGVEGLHARVLEGFERVRAAGMAPQVSLVFDDAVPDEEQVPWLAGLSRALYGVYEGDGEAEQIARLLQDPMSYASHLVDVGSAVGLRRGLHRLEEIPDRALRCKNFFRPHPSLRIQASGEVSLCPLIDAGEGYGSVREEGLVAVLNRMHEAFVHRLHAENRIVDYRPLLDRSIFGERFDHACSLRTVLTMIATRMDARGVGFEDKAAIRAINEEVARKAGYLPPEGPVAVGVERS